MLSYQHRRTLAALKTQDLVGASSCTLWSTGRSQSGTCEKAPAPQAHDRHEKHCLLYRSLYPGYSEVSSFVFKANKLSKTPLCSETWTFTDTVIFRSLPFGTVNLFHCQNNLSKTLPLWHLPPLSSSTVSSFLLITLLTSCSGFQDLPVSQSFYQFSILLSYHLHSATT